jgi:DNA polymerase-1
MARAIEPVTVDFETEKIEGRPVFPPKPCGVSIIEPGGKPHYYAFAHDSDNNCTKGQAAKVLQGHFRSGKPLLFHNAKFDVEVAVEHMGCRMPPWHLLNDTMYVLFLLNPHARDLGLKPSAAEILGMPPDEQDAMFDWLVEHSYLKPNQRNRVGEHIARVPGRIAGRYANGDTLRTLKLWRKLVPQVVERGMWAAYQREQQLMPILLANEKEGIRVDVAALQQDEQLYANEIVRVDQWLRKRLKARDLNIDSDQDLADALENAGIVTEWNYTEKGARSVSKKNLTRDMFSDQRVHLALGYRNRAATCLNTFMRPWLRMAEHAGRIHTNWHQTRGGSDEGGARTGRLSSSPNFQNIPKTFDDKGDGYEHPKHVKGLVELPLMRRYVLPDKGHVFLHRDYNQQELRILAHFEDALLLDRYRDDVRLDVHNFVRDEIERIFGIRLERRAVKVINFGMLYGMGRGRLAESLDTDVQEAGRLKRAQLEALPGLKNLDDDLKEMGRTGVPIRTWGGRYYYCEEPKVIKGRRQTFEYKLLNYLIQGSAADCSKQSIINYDAIRKESRLLVSVHDENNLSSPKRAMKQEMRLLREAMESVAFDVAMLTDGKFGPTWGALQKYED